MTAPPPEDPSKDPYLSQPGLRSAMITAVIEIMLPKTLIDSEWKAIRHVEFMIEIARIAKTSAYKDDLELLCHLFNLRLATLSTDPVEPLDELTALVDRIEAFIQSSPDIHFDPHAFFMALHAQAHARAENKDEYNVAVEQQLVRLTTRPNAQAEALPMQDSTAASCSETKPPQTTPASAAACCFPPEPRAETSAAPLYSVASESMRLDQELASLLETEEPDAPAPEPSAYTLLRPAGQNGKNVIIDTLANHMSDMLNLDKKNLDNYIIYYQHRSSEVDWDRSTTPDLFRQTDHTYRFLLLLTSLSGDIAIDEVDKAGLIPSHLSQLNPTLARAIHRQDPHAKIVTGEATVEEIRKRGQIFEFNRHEYLDSYNFSYEGNGWSISDSHRKSARFFIEMKKEVRATQDCFGVLDELMTEENQKPEPSASRLTLFGMAAQAVEAAFNQSDLLMRRLK